jgi:protein-S-isoprenylcysteine O-methyltransferase Ste14
MSGEHLGVMSVDVKHATRADSRAAGARADRRRIALAAMLALAGASSLVLLSDLQVGPAWVHWVGSLVAVAAALGMVVIAELSWDRAIDTAKSVGLVAPESDD